jgi:hypothetical protein
MGISFKRVSSWTTSGGTMTCVTGPQYSLGAQFLQLRLGQPEAAKDLGVMLVEFGGDIAHSHTLADLNGCADVRHLAQFRVACILHEPAMAHLRSANICA